MDSKLLVVLTAVLIGFVHQSSGSERFVMNIGTYRNGDINSTISIRNCRATPITKRHVLTTADCASTQPPEQLTVIAEQFLVIGTVEFLFREFAPVERTFIHPSYTAGQPDSFNVAVVLMDQAEFEEEFIPIQALGSLSTVSSCNLFGWGAAAAVPRRELVVISEPSACDPTLPHAYCSLVSSMSHTSCSAQLGSPVKCSSNTVDGFVINGQQQCIASNGRNLLKYHSVAQYRNWIEEVSGAPISAKTSLLLILSAVLIAFKSL